MAFFVLWLTNRDRTNLYAACLSLLVFPIAQVISVCDYVMRASVPAVLMLGIYASSLFVSGLERHSRELRTAFICFFLLCSITSISEIDRSLKRTWQLSHERLSLLADEVGSFENPKQPNDPLLSNFRSDKFQNSFYWKYLCSKTTLD